MLQTDQNQIILESILFGILNLRRFKFIQPINIYAENNSANFSLLRVQKATILEVENKLRELKELFIDQIHFTYQIRKSNNKSFPLIIDCNIYILPETDRMNIINYLQLTNNIHIITDSLQKELFK